MSEHHACPRCQAVVSPGVGPAGLCPRCLLELGLGGGAGVRGAWARRDRARIPEPADLAPCFPGLEIERFIGRGGMGLVYEATQLALDRPVALKLLPRSAAQSPDFAERFAREARAMARLSHPNVVGVHDSGLSGDWFFLVMELVDGTTLRDLMDAGPVPPAQAIEIIRQLCDALQFAHDAGVVHRDIKPANVLIDRNGRVKVADFGLARLLDGAGDPGLTASGDVMGTPHYMAPEQWEGARDVDQRADIFALGVVFYELLTGGLPMGRFEPPSRRAGVDEGVDDVVMRALAQDPKTRYQHARDISADLDEEARGPGTEGADTTESARIVVRSSSGMPGCVPGPIGMFLILLGSVLGLPAGGHNLIASFFGMIVMAVVLWVVLWVVKVVLRVVGQMVEELIDETEGREPNPPAVD